ncbi:MAG: hypothetical protein ABSA65_11730 [Acidimicrobiales bacterium]|jgi:hypothetical protein
MNDIQIFLFDDEVDVDAIVEEVGRDWRAVFEELDHSLDLIVAVADPTLRFRLSLFGEDHDLTDAIVNQPEGDWRAIVQTFASELDAIFAPGEAGQDTYEEPQAAQIGG